MSTSDSTWTQCNAIQNHRRVKDPLCLLANSGSVDKVQNPILLLSPWPESIYAFLPTWEMFSGLGPLVAVDLPGFGLSQSRPDVMAPEAMGEFILRIVDAFGLDRPHAIGPDVGTPALLFAAANHPGSFQEPGHRERRHRPYAYSGHPGRTGQRSFARAVQASDW